MTFFWALGCSSWFSGVLGGEVDDTRDGSWKCCFTALLYLAAKPGQVGVDVDGLASPLPRPMAYGCQTRGHGLLLGAILSRRCSREVAPFRGM
jgi:hypothetical protein